MKTIQLLHDTADKEQAKADNLRGEAEKQRQVAQDNMGDPTVSLRATNEAQKYEQQAAIHDQIAMKASQQAAQLEAKAVELQRRKTEVQTSSQAEIDRLDAEERAIRG